MGQVNADNPKPRAPGAAPPAPANPSGSLEDRIDSLLSEMQESLDEIDRSTAPHDAAAHEHEHAPDAPDANQQAQDEALATALDQAAAQAERALTDEPPPAAAPSAKGDTPAPSGVSVVLDPEVGFGPPASTEAESPGAAPSSAAGAAPSTPAPAQSAEPTTQPSTDAHTHSGTPEPIAALDEKLAAQAESLAEQPEAQTDHGGPAASSEPGHATTHRGTKAPKVAPMIKVPAAPTESTPAVTASRTEPESPEAKPKGKAKIAVRKRETGDADASPEHAPAPAQAEPGDATPALGASAPAALPTTQPHATGAAHRVLETLARPLRFVPPHVRDYLGWFGLLTVFNAACVWIFWLLLRA